MTAPDLAAVADSDYVIFVVDPTGARKTWLTGQLAKNHDQGRHPHTENVKAWRCNFGGGSDNVVVIDTPSGSSTDKLTIWLESKFSKKCHSAILFLHSLDSNPESGDMWMSWHLRHFAKAFSNKFSVPSDIYVVPTINPGSALPSETLSQRLSQLKTMTERLNGNRERDWHASIFPGVFKGQPETAWSAALLLLKDIADTQAKEVLVSSSPALKRISTKSPDSRSALKDIADILFEEFKKKKMNRDLDAIIMLGKNALEFTPLDRLDRHSVLIDLAGLLSERFNKEGRKEDLDELITLKRTMSEYVSPDKPQRQSLLLELDGYLSERFRRTDFILDLKEIISLRRAALERIPQPNRCRALLILAAALHEQFRKQGMENSIAEAVSLARAASSLCPRGHLDHAFSRAHLARYLETARLALKDLAELPFREFEKKERDRDLDAMITLGKTALEFTPPEHPQRCSVLIGLAGLLSERFNKEGRKEDLDESITLKRAASEYMSRDEPQRQTILLELDDHLFERFKQTDSTVDLEEIISLRRVALERIPQPNRCRALLNLADALHGQFQKQCMENSMAEAVSLARAVLGLCPPGYPDHALSRDHLARYLETTRSALNDPANLLFKKFKRNEKDRDLDAMITLGQTALEFTPPEHPLRLSTLIHLSGLLSERFNQYGRKEDLDKLITLKRTGSEYISPDEPQRQTILLELDGYLSERFKRTDSMMDLGEIISLSLRRAALGHTPLPNRCRALLNLADALHEQFQKQGTENSIVDAIRLTRAALGLCPPGHPDHALPRDHLASYIQTKVGKKAARAHVRGPAAGPSSTSSYDIEQSIKKAVSARVAKIPLRLLHTPTGILCNRDAQISYFEGSLQYKRLLSLASSLDSQQLESEINNVIEEYFGFATLSHRWGSGEPLLRDVEGKSIDDLGSTDGVEKLQMFCALALQRNFQWAWSDTCCIDKDSSAELQEAIGSMFSWYHWSSLTVVHLSDVFDGGSLAGCVWFTRGWTLQELLASHTILFYTCDWSLYSKSDAVDHKSDPALLEELQNATGIAKQHLTNFYPGMDDARSRLHWASRRHTTRPEDIAYSLFGIFQVHLPIFYGESAQNALGRLLAEIISRSGDVSVLDWVGKPSSFNSCFPVDLAPYRTVPQFLLTLSDPARHTSLDLDKAQQLYSSLNRLPRAGFVNSKLTLPSTVHTLTAVKLQCSSTSPSRYTYEIQASRLRPLNITLSVELGENVDTYILVRPWHPKTLEQQADRDVDTVWKLLEQLEQPFNALLLKRSLRNEYKRIACDCTITACIQDITSTLDSEVLIPEIV
ncbi:hypothetical protein PISMIDRAFT_16691 [Pisolithus microcarpus 441]|uniref:Heterokaryon incompatibility domain-containing protein n=1 Tax=Pisolithus microcarpus 441 TaxID=765257 RepID=A0A0C9YYF0_9AGAM|nr:hypothetical protein BKA83DRAFT_16691 [Pisolithus microcarpus]KIK15202.1 hypothetical protein PISMIDRAFT_16691 [Pisolithus microcarpus 441]